MRDEKCLPKDVAIYAFFSGKINKFGNLTGVKDLTNDTSARMVTSCSKCVFVFVFVFI